ncbi:MULTISPECIES: competence/damage-inducible protein A [unclassified Cellulophaga]|uniref:competence/damage-inducible protein A n=1 Tax=unclassified Cellulophaga TaxID=2634405 RepID=UPI0026E175D3|nr:MULTISPECIES: competence/damage-inducible protein A [unclassified Cellulophaga]MDO6492646.1 competence/damage-inducible protein A [Cellulophaga sp. 2_MG-2023]MDO6495903.1 competence/damage-inducible protein A [Cellulophaga sp. 3_MG-2023]
MLAEIITIGDELLIGQVIDTNSAFIGKELNKIGVTVYQITSIQDNKEQILSALKDASKRVDIVLITGGLGPTKDDITKHTLCEYFNDTLVQNNQVLAHVEELFKKFSDKPILEVNKQQAKVLSKATVLHNLKGTAPGMWIKDNDTVFVSMPGVPFEMRYLITEEVVPRIIKEYKRPHIIHKTFITYGVGESALAEQIEAWEDQLPVFIKLAYLPSLGSVRLRLSGTGKNKDILEHAIKDESQKLIALIGDIVYGEEGEDVLEVATAKLLTEKGKTLATAESFTGGKISEIFTSIPGASAYFKGSVVCYATEVKINVLGVSEALIKEYSVVSEQVAIAMATNVQKALKTDFAIATTGNAGPTKGDSNAEVGTVYIGIATPTKIFAIKEQLGGQRERVVNKAINKALELLYKEILGC